MKLRTIKVRQRLIGDIIAVLISPLYVLSQLFKIKDAKSIILIGTIFFGIIGSIYVYVPQSDGHTHLIEVRDTYINMSFSEFLDKGVYILSFKESTGVVDIYMHTLSFLSGGVFGIPELLHVFAGLVYGYFYIQGVVFLFRSLNTKNVGFIFLSVIVLFFAYRRITGLNSIRMWTAAWVLFCGAIGWSANKRKKYFMYMLSAPFFHFSFLGLLLPTFVALLFARRKWILLASWVISFGFALSYEVVQGYIPDISVVKSREATLSVQVDESGNTFEEDSRFYRKYGPLLFRRFSIVILTLLSFWLSFRSFIDKDNIFTNMLAIGAILYAFGNIFEFSPAVSGRSQAIAGVFILAAIIRFIGLYRVLQMPRRSLSYIRIGLSVTLISSIPIFLFHLSYAISMLSAFALILAPLSWVLGSDDFSIRDMIGLFL